MALGLEEKRVACQYASNMRVPPRTSNFLSLKTILVNHTLLDKTSESGVFLNYFIWTRLVYNIQEPKDQGQEFLLCMII